MTDSQYDAGWLEDFGRSREDDATIQRLLERARASGDAELRRALQEVQLWRWLVPHLLDRVAPRGNPIDESDQLLKLARFFIRGEGGSESA